MDTSGHFIRPLKTATSVQKIVKKLRKKHIYKMINTDIQFKYNLKLSFDQLNI